MGLALVHFQKYMLLRNPHFSSTALHKSLGFLVDSLHNLWRHSAYKVWKFIKFIHTVSLFDITTSPTFLLLQVARMGSGSTLKSLLILVWQYENMVPLILTKNKQSSLSWVLKVLRIVSFVHFLEESMTT